MKIWASPHLTVDINIRIFNTSVKPVLLYGTETWTNTAETLKKIYSLEPLLEESFRPDGLIP